MRDALLAAVIVLTASLSQLGCDEPVKVIAIQPLESVEMALLKRVASGIVKLYEAEVEILPAIHLPDDAYYRPNNRYRADKLLTFLGNSRERRFYRIIGITQKDISTTKGGIFDWGIFGLGTLNGRTCVVSTFRLRRGGVSHEALVVRLIKVVNHELGHTFGLPHCPVAGCLMEDAKGTIRTVDMENGSLCPKCRCAIKDILRNKDR